jgi:hypothetical protein
MAKKATHDATTARIRYSQAKALASEYLGDPEFVEREFLRGLAAGEIPWWCARFEASQQYSGPGPGDPKFWEVDPDQLVTSDGPLVVVSLRGIRIEGDSATRIDGAAAYGIELDRSALVRLKLLPPSDDRSSARKKRKAPQVDRILSALQPGALFPDGVPPDMTTNVALPKVVKYLQPETERLGLSAPEWDSVDRALKQYRAK